jgi:transposase
MGARRARLLLWEEYCDTTSDSFSYSWFCERYKEWASRLKLSLRQVHIAGDKLFVDKLFVDYSGHTMEVIDALTGEVLTAQIFVAVRDWIASHVRAFAYFGSAARQRRQPTRTGVATPHWEVRRYRRGSDRGPAVRIATSSS